MESAPTNPKKAPTSDTLGTPLRAGPLTTPTKTKAQEDSGKKNPNSIIPPLADPTRKTSTATPTRSGGKSPLKPLYKDEWRVDNYKFIELLGKGSFSLVYRAKNIKDGRDYAVKIINEERLLQQKNNH
jgi:hypothetical protein